MHNIRNTEVLDENANKNKVYCIICFSYCLYPLVHLTVWHLYTIQSLLNIVLLSNLHEGILKSKYQNYYIMLAFRIAH